MNQLRLDRAARIQTTVNTPGWVDISALAVELISAAKDEAYQILKSRPESMTGRTAIRLSSRAGALEDFLESVADEIKILQPPTQRGRGAT